MILFVGRHRMIDGKLDCHGGLDHKVVMKGLDNKKFSKSMSNDVLTIISQKIRKGYRGLAWFKQETRDTIGCGLRE